MIFDPENNIVQLCARGMELEGADPQEASRIFQQAWNEAADEYEKTIAAHYVARHQDRVENKLKWDQTALECAQRSDYPGIQSFYPSLYLNIAKGYHDLQQLDKAIEYYKAGLEASEMSAPEDGYSIMIRNGLKNGLDKIGRSK